MDDREKRQATIEEMIQQKNMKELSSYFCRKDTSDTLRTEQIIKKLAIREAEYLAWLDDDE